MSFRSATQATDSTCAGWRAKSAATNALRQAAPVIRRSTRNQSAVLARWRARFVVWWSPACIPKSWQSSMWDSQVSGCQFAAWPLESAQTSPGALSPPRTIGLSVTYFGSS